MYVGARDGPGGLRFRTNLIETCPTDVRGKKHLCQPPICTGVARTACAAPGPEKSRPEAQAVQAPVRRLPRLHGRGDAAVGERRRSIDGFTPFFLFVQCTGGGRSSDPRSQTAVAGCDGSSSVRAAPFTASCPAPLQQLSCSRLPARCLCSALRRTVASIRDSPKPSSEAQRGCTSSSELGRTGADYENDPDDDGALQQGAAPAAEVAVADDAPNGACRRCTQPKRRWRTPRPRPRASSVSAPVRPAGKAPHALQAEMRATQSSWRKKEGAAARSGRARGDAGAVISALAVTSMKRCSESTRCVVDCKGRRRVFDRVAS